MKVLSTSVMSRINMEEIHKLCSSAQWNKKVVKSVCMKERKEGGREGEERRGRGRERERGEKEGEGERGVDGVNNVYYLHVVV